MPTKNLDNVPRWFLVIIAAAGFTVGCHFLSKIHERMEQDHDLLIQMVVKVEAHDKEITELIKIQAQITSLIETKRRTYE